MAIIYAFHGLPRFRAGIPTGSRGNDGNPQEPTVKCDCFVGYLLEGKKKDAWRVKTKAMSTKGFKHKIKDLPARGCGGVPRDCVGSRRKCNVNPPKVVVNNRNSQENPVLLPCSINYSTDSKCMEIQVPLIYLVYII